MNTIGKDLKILIRSNASDRIGGEFSREEVENYFLRCLDAADHYDFLIISPQGKIIGESVINEIDWEIRKANFRIAVFNSKDCGKGIGSFAIRNTCKFVFEVLKLHRLELDVFPSIRLRKSAPS